MATRNPDDVPLAVPTSSTLTVQLAPMKRKHIRAVSRIEQQTSSSPWSSSLFLSELALRNNRAYTVAQVGSLVIGYSGLMFIDDDAHISTLAVDPLWQRHKIATRLLLHNVRLALHNGARHLTLEVRLSNEPAKGLYQRFGFAPAGIRKNYYTEDKEDALVMWAHDIDSEDFALRLSAIEAAVPGATIAEVPR
jgi:ribosomal-protein-alanine N-acetyltransferase